MALGVFRFPVADVLWTLVMAVNVFLIVYRRYDTETLRRLEWKYIIGITAFTFIPAVVFLFIRSEDKGPMYGSVEVCGLRDRPDTSRLWGADARLVVDLVRHRPEMGAIPDCVLLCNDMVRAVCPTSPSST